MLLNILRDQRTFLPMRSISKSLILISFVFSAVCGIGTGFLSLPASASEISLGQNPLMGNSNWANPALGSFPGSPSYLDISYGSWLSGVRSFKLNVGSNLGDYKTGYRVRHVSLNDLEYRTERPTDEALASFGASGTAADFHINRSWKNAKAGVALRWVYMDMHTESSHGFSLDLGGLYNMGEKFQFAASILNIGAMSEFKSESPALPLRALAGVSVKLQPGSTPLLVGVHSEYNSHVSGLIAGVSATMQFANLAIQSGLKTSENVVSVSGGIGLSMGIYKLHYGLLYGTHQLGIPQMIDLSIRLP